jgi:hypothetical protein
MITIKKICNYKENIKPSQPTANLNYIDFVSEEDELYNRELKRINRELVIDITLGEKDESEWEDRQPIKIIEDKDNFGTISAKVMSVSVRASKFTGEKDLEDTLFSYLEKLTKNAPIIKNGVPKYDIQYDNTQNSEYNQRKIISRMVVLGNLISMESRVGPGNTVIIGDNINIDYGVSTYGNVNKISNFDILRSSIINPNKIIVIRAGNDLGPGLNVMNNINDGTYYMVETPNWQRLIKWFWVK